MCGEGNCWLVGEKRGEGVLLRVGDSFAEPPVDPPEADWCPPESNTTQVRPEADEG